MKFSNIVWIVFLGLIFLSLGLRWVQSLDFQLEEASYQDETNSNTKSDNLEDVKKENSCGDKVCSNGESYQSCSKDCGYSLLGECVKSCNSNTYYQELGGEALEMWKYACEQQCNEIQSIVNSMKTPSFVVQTQEEKDFMQREMDNMFNTRIEEYKNN